MKKEQPKEEESKFVNRFFDSNQDCFTRAEIMQIRGYAPKKKKGKSNGR